MRIGLYSPYFGSTYGGGEKYLCVFAEAIRERLPEAEIELLTQVDADLAEYERRLNVDLAGIQCRSLRRPGDQAVRRLGRRLRLRLYRDLVAGARAIRATEAYDLFFSMVYVAAPFSRARRSVVLCQFPYPIGGRVWRRGPLGGWVHWLYSLPYRVLRRPLLGRELDDFEQVVCQSEFVRGWVRRYWGRDSLVIPPPIDIPGPEPDWSAKRPVILSVGRFFVGGHNKKHDVMIEAFRQMCDAGLTGWELRLAGSLHAEPEHLAYFEGLRQRAAGYPVSLLPDLAYPELQAEYRQASIYWHAAGHGVDPEREPINLEHFGMTTAEAMGHGAVPVAIAAGGQPEIVREGETGHLWSTVEELKARTRALIESPTRRRAMAEAARRASHRFSRESFKAQVAELAAELAAATGRPR